MLVGRSKIWEMSSSSRSSTAIKAGTSIQYWRRLRQAVIGEDDVVLIFAHVVVVVTISVTVDACATSTIFLPSLSYLKKKFTRSKIQTVRIIIRFLTVNPWPFAQANSVKTVVMKRMLTQQLISQTLRGYGAVLCPMSCVFVPSLYSQH